MHKSHGISHQLCNILRVDQPFWSHRTFRSAKLCHVNWSTETPKLWSSVISSSQGVWTSGTTGCSQSFCSTPCFLHLLTSSYCIASGVPTSSLLLDTLVQVQCWTPANVLSAPLVRVESVSVNWAGVSSKDPSAQGKQSDRPRSVSGSSGGSFLDGEFFWRQI